MLLEVVAEDEVKDVELWLACVTLEEEGEEANEILEVRLVVPLEELIEDVGINVIELPEVRLEPALLEVVVEASEVSLFVELDGEALPLSAPLVNDGVGIVAPDVVPLVYPNVEDIPAVVLE